MKSVQSLLSAAVAPAVAPSVTERRAPRAIRRRTAVPETLDDPSLDPVLRRIYAARGIRARDELDLSAERLLPVGSLPSVNDAAALLAAHRARSVLVVGDFDADGATSTALLVRGLRAFGFTAVDFLVPNRFDYGYGLTPEIVELALSRSTVPTLLVTVDNGISSVAGVRRARDAGLDVLITDHHLPGSELPDAQVIVNPNLRDSGFGSRALAGVGVAFYVLAALRRSLAAAGVLPADAPNVGQWLDLVALGTVADLVPLDRNNRVLVAQGLKRIRAGRCVPGISLLLEVAGRRREELTAADLGFAVGPRLNAAGRLDDMSIGIRCLLDDDLGQARAAASRLDQLNVERREIEASMQAVAVEAVRHVDLARDGRRHAVCLFDAGWHQGVVGLVASRIKDRLSRPVIAFARAGDGMLRGSARSMPGVHVRDVLEAIATREPGLIERFGGHAMAAGLSLAETSLDRFARCFENEVERCTGGRGCDDGIDTDGALEEPDYCLDTARRLRDAGPWGQGFPEPAFDGEFHIEDARVVAERHLKLTVRPGTSTARFDAMAFNYFAAESGPAARRDLPSGRVHAVFRLAINDWRGVERLQLLLDHLRVA